MPWPQYSRTTEKLRSSTKVWMAWPMSPSARPAAPLDARHMASAGLGQPLRGQGGLADEVHAAGVAVEALADHRHVDVDDVTGFQPCRSGCHGRRRG